MKILAVETSTKHFSLAVLNGEKVIAERSVFLKKVLSDSIIPAIHQILKRAKTPLVKLDGFAVGLGPGSFTSLRVGLATVKGLAFATGKPVVGIPSLDALAMNGSPKDAPEVCAICDAKRNLLYACLYQTNGVSLKRKTDYLLCPIDDILKKLKRKVFFVGDGIGLFREKILGHSRAHLWTPVFAEEKYWYPRAKNAALLAKKKFQEKKFDNPATLIPLYLYPDDCQVGKK